jgi:hypothetical protein
LFRKRTAQRFSLLGPNGSVSNRSDSNSDRFQSFRAGRSVGLVPVDPGPRLLYGAGYEPPDVFGIFSIFSFFQFQAPGFRISMTPVEFHIFVPGARIRPAGAGLGSVRPFPAGGRGAP